MPAISDTIELRPQPVGIYAAPAANLLLPRTKESAVLTSLLAGDVGADVPDEWGFFVAAACGDIESAVHMIAELNSPIAVYNQFVLSPTAETYGRANDRLSGELQDLLQVAAYASGFKDELPSTFDLDGELLALALATQAAADIERGDNQAARTRLKEAVTAARGSHKVLASVLLSQQADLTLAAPDAVPVLVSQTYREAIRLAADCKLPMLLPELYTKLGMVFQDSANGQRGALLESVNCYQAALQSGITEEEHPELFAQLQNNLGLAYLAMPTMEASNQLRTGIAVQSFRHALRIYTIETNADMWASISMNLANALQYAPTSHPEENLIQAVETYEEVLSVRGRAKDPVAYAIVLLNQANALAHLGIFKPALEKLSEAYKLFHWYEEIDKANAAKELVEQINVLKEKQGNDRQNEPSEVSTN